MRSCERCFLAAATSFCDTASIHYAHWRRLSDMARPASTFARASINEEICSVALEALLLRRWSIP